MRAYNIEFKERVREKYIYDIIVSHGCVGYNSIKDLSLYYAVPSSTINTWVSNEGWYKARSLYIDILGCIVGYLWGKLIPRDQPDDMGLYKERWGVVNAVIDEIIAKRVWKPFIDNIQKKLNTGLVRVESEDIKGPLLKSVIIISKHVIPGYLEAISLKEIDFIFSEIVKVVDGAGIKIDEDMLLGVVRPLKSI